MRLSPVFRRGLLALPGLLLAYLAVVALWAWSALDASLAAFPAPAHTLSPRQSSILLQIEDPTFFTHHGVSLADGQGVTTLTSAMARDLFLMHGALDGVQGAMQGFYRAVFNCCKKVDIGRDVMALVLDARVGKQRQLDMYAASVYLGTQEGRQIHGLTEAAQAYLGKPLAQASEQEFAGLVGMIKAPNQYHPLRQRAAFEARLHRVEAVLAGRCHPDGVFDTEFKTCAK
ncbi:transglycosylase domain-containing protein [Massilia sp. CF038]|uniref:transglycosylase domain-containing protein n=1 Tax=Massilia sp. CF038 TaxID=1881045 RepID=UPI000916ED56|nr:transglycosylase domain-containing protein [Massilia sp. CF038]SHH54236.1 Transglycosylase [Massilia sp. CF038]